MNILVVEDEKTDFLLIEHAIEKLDDIYRVIHAQGCNEAIATLRDETVVLALVDILLPDGDGYKISEHLKKQNIPYVMVSSKSLPENAVQGLRSGAEDYIRKPFDVEELTARLERVLLRTRSESGPSSPVPFAEKEGMIQIGEARIALTPIEQQLFHILRERYDAYVPTAELIAAAWGSASPDNAKGALRTYISHIRKKIARANSPLAVVSKWGRGYRLTESTESSP